MDSSGTTLYPANPGRSPLSSNPERDLWLIDDSRQRVVEPGLFQIKIGSSSEDIRLAGPLEINGDPLVVDDLVRAAFSDRSTDSP